MSSSLPKIEAAGCARIEQPVSPEDLVRSNLVADYKNIRQFLKTRVRSVSDAEDILQIFCLKALRHARQIRRSETVRIWMSHVLRTTLIDYFRQAEGDARQFEAYTKFALPLVPIDDRPTRLRIHWALAALKPEYAEVLTRIDLHGESRSHVAASLKTSENNLTVRLFRARRAFKAALADSCGKSCAHVVGPKCGWHSQRHQMDRGPSPSRQNRAGEAGLDASGRRNGVRNPAEARLLEMPRVLGLNHES
jgi:RNA polymerase sigma factor (sigma-70 family)